MPSDTIDGGTVDVDAREAMKPLWVNVTFRPRYRNLWRVKFGARLIRLGAWIAGAAGVEFASKDAPAPGPNPRPQPHSDESRTVRITSDGDIRNTTVVDVATGAELRVTGIDWHLDSEGPAVATLRMHACEIDATTVARVFTVCPACGEEVGEGADGARVIRIDRRDRGA